MRTVLTVLAMLLLVAGSAMATDAVDMTGGNVSEQLDEDYELATIEEEYDVAGVNYKEYYYTVVYDDEKIIKIELNGGENTAETINLTSDMIRNFIENKDQMTWWEKLDFFINKVGISVKTLFKLKNIFE